MLHPIRRRILERLREPGSASSVARSLELSRQKVNYHLRELERHALVELVEERRKGNCVERILRTTARYWVIGPETVGALAADPENIRDRFSAAYLTALASRTVRDLGELRERADRQGKKVATFSLETELRFSSPEARAAFADELAQHVAKLVERYHDADASGGRSFRMVVGAYPSTVGRGGESESKNEQGGYEE